MKKNTITIENFEVGNPPAIGEDMIEIIEYGPCDFQILKNGEEVCWADSESFAKELAEKGAKFHGTTVSPIIKKVED